MYRTHTCTCVGVDVDVDGDVDVYVDVDVWVLEYVGEHYDSESFHPHNLQLQLQFATQTLLKSFGHLQKLRFVVGFE